MTAAAPAILAALDRVAAERRARAADPGLADAVQALKAWQQARFARTYADLLADPACAPAGRFFLEELYGPGDFSRRDAQFARIAQPAGRLLPPALAGTLVELAELHALSEALDSAMARAARPGAAWTPARYHAAWQTVTGATTDAPRARQLASCLRIGRTLARHAGQPALGWLLKSMRGPAAAAGLGELQHFLESGLAAFRRLDDPGAFLATVEAREQRLIEALGPGGDPAVAESLLGAPAAEA